MNLEEFDRSRQFAGTPSGRIAFVERGQGPVALFFHGAFLNGYQWRDVIDRGSDARRCIAFDNMGHGYTEIPPDQPVDFDAQAEMAAQFLDALGVDAVDVVCNDSGGGIAQVFAAHHPHRVRTLALTNCDVHTNSPPPSFQPTIELIRASGARAIAERLLSDIEFARSPAAFGVAYEAPEHVEASTLEAYLRPILRSEESLAAFERFILSLDPKHTVEIENALRKLDAPTLVAWGAADTTFELSWAYWLVDTIPGAWPVVEVEGAKLFWPEERPEQLLTILNDFWSRAVDEPRVGVGPGQASR